ncbi:acyl-ACP--UDP-N-acetylglucosamine O-acyltransferase [Hyphococcus sp.]|uniref:acyl-ACP--UDP-N-acetylglucosamine O-acyltransferase n=1 Tax=Hyphococcus sp. TaxID=2038636 RepID=UPI003CCC1313
MSIHPTAVIEDGAELGEVQVGPFCYVGSKVRLHGGVSLHAHVVVTGNTEIHAGTSVHSFSVLGGPPQHLRFDNEQTKLVIGKNNTIREYVTMNCGTIEGGGETSVGAGGYFMTGAHIAHDCRVGDNVIFANNATLGGHVTVGEMAFLGGLCAVHQFSRIGDYAFIGGCAAVTSDIIPFASAIGNHAYLVGLNVVGLKRQKFSRATIKELREAYTLLFSEKDTFRERVEVVRKSFSHSEEVLRILKFVDETKSRPLMTPAR